MNVLHNERKAVRRVRGLSLVFLCFSVNVFADYSINGFELGMDEAEITAQFKAQGRQPDRYTSSPVRLGDLQREGLDVEWLMLRKEELESQSRYLNRLAISDWSRKPREEVTVDFSSPITGNKAIYILRKLHYGQNEGPFKQDVIDQLIKRYGTPKAQYDGWFVWYDNCPKKPTRKHLTQASKIYVGSHGGFSGCSSVLTVFVGGEEQVTALTMVLVDIPVMEKENKGLMAYNKQVAADIKAHIAKTSASVPEF